jgi:PIN domain nuclease of toxin-antitoxin system
VRLLLDTHILVWLATERDKLTVAELAAIAAAEALFLSAISIWEIRLKWRNSLPKALATGLVTPEAALAFVDSSPIKLVSLDAHDSARPLEPQPPHGDPFDEMLLAQADGLGAKLLTRDKHLRDHPLAYRP